MEVSVQSLKVFLNLNATNYIYTEKKIWVPFHSVKSIAHFISYLVVIHTVCKSIEIYSKLFGYVSI